MALGISGSASAQSTTTRVSVATGGVQGEGFSAGPAISANGRFVAFHSGAPLVPDDTNGVADVFVHDRHTRQTERVSLGSGVIQATGGASVSASISADGRYVAFESFASNLVPDDTNGTWDIFVRDRHTATTTRVNVSTDGGQAFPGAGIAFISGDGRYVSFCSDAPNLVADDTNNASDVFLRDLWVGTTVRVSVATGGVQANGASCYSALSANGRVVVFESHAPNLVTPDINGIARDIFVRDLDAGTTTRISFGGLSGSRQLGNATFFPAISADGRFIAFSTDALNAGELYRDLLVHDREIGWTLGMDASHATVEEAGGRPEEVKSAAFSADGRFLCYTLFTPHPSPRYVVMMVHRESRLKRVVDVPARGGVSENDGGNNRPVCVPNADGSVAAFSSPSKLVAGDTNNEPDIFVRTEPFTSLPRDEPFGNVDTPTNNRTGVTGALTFAGWALDDVGVTRVSICRLAFGNEVAPPHRNCGGAAEIFVGDAVFVDGARPDVYAAHIAHPQAWRAGWGYMLLTNTLPAQGNGTYVFSIRAQDTGERWTVLGRRSIGIANASATLPFGTIDTPLQGGPASGHAYVNFGWALTPQPKMIPFDGSTIHVLINGSDAGTVDYNHPRPDIQAIFPGLNNTTGAVGFKILDTTLLKNGLNSIAWTVADNQGAVEGIGSRYFTVSNPSAVTAAATSARAETDASTVPLDRTPLPGRRGWDLGAPYGSFGAGATGVTVIRSEEVNRVELLLGAGEVTGYLRTVDGLAPLPIGSRLDPTTNTFTWAPGVGYIGRYDLVFVRSEQGRAVSRHEVQIALNPKGSLASGVEVVIDVPGANTIVDQPFMIGGWAADLGSLEGTGVSTLHAWAFPASGGAPIFLGAVAHGARPDVAAAHGERFKQAGFGLVAQGLPADDYDLALFAWSTETMGFVAPTIVRVSVKR